MIQTLRQFPFLGNCPNQYPQSQTLQVSLLASVNFSVQAFLLFSTTFTPPFLTSFKSFLASCSMEDANFTSFSSALVELDWAQIPVATAFGSLSRTEYFPLPRTDFALYSSFLFSCYIFLHFFFFNKRLDYLKIICFPSVFCGKTSPLPVLSTLCIFCTWPKRLVFQPQGAINPQHCNLHRSM